MRYFDKSFFKFTLGFLTIVAISLLIIYAASAYAAGVEKIVFTTPVQTIKPNTPSEKITTQLQDSSGEYAKTESTTHIELTSDSQTGVFSSNENFADAGNTLNLTMNKGTYNRSFYYKNSSEGSFLINVKVIEENLMASQQIAVSSGTSQNTLNNSNSSGEVLGETTSNTASSNSQSSGGSVTNVSSPSAQLEVSAGVDRTTTPGSPIWFQATIKKNTTGTSPELSWSFGDGFVGVGSLVSHSYKYDGDYVVVLSTKAGDIFSVSRLKVKVGVPDISVQDKGEYLEILNKSNNEINLFNWKIENEGRGFIFQPNTIILPHSSIKLDKVLLTMKGYENTLGISLENSLKEEVFVVAPVEEIKKTDLTEASKNLEDIKNEVLTIQSKISNVAKATKVENTEKNIEKKEKTAASAESFGVPKENIIYEAPKSDGIFTKLTNFIKRVFSK